MLGTGNTPVSDPPQLLQQALAERYVIERELGHGGGATVYLARDLKVPRHVALKVLAPELALAVRTERFQREIEIAAGLNHPHILPLFEADSAGGFVFYTMPPVEGESLHDRLGRQGPLPIDEALDITRQVAQALDYAHRRGVIHRDIKPGNILLAGSHAWVADFGIARAIAKETREPLTDTGSPIGTVSYMSPEQISGTDGLDGRTDVYSLGCVLYEMLTGTPPFTGPTLESVVAKQLVDPAPSIRATRPDVPEGVVQVVERALAKRPSDRLATAGEFAAALGLPDTAAVSSGKLLRRLRRHWRTGVAVAAVALAAAAVVLSRLSPNLDASLFVVVPFGHVEGAAPALVTGDRCESLLLEAFGRWDDVRLVDELRVHDLLTQRGRSSMRLGAAMGIARDLGSGRLVWGDVAQFGDTVQVRAALYDVTRAGVTIRRHSVRFGVEGRETDKKFRELADSLLLGHPRSVETAEGIGGTRRLAAWQAYAEGKAALAVWDMRAAERGFRGAIEADPGYTHAHLWLAYTLAWVGRPVVEWRPYAVTSARFSDSLGFHDRTLSRALAHLAADEFPEACEEYGRLLARDSLDFAAWFGLGECQSKDRLVVRYPSGWRFRSSYAAAGRAYERALELVPSVHRAFAGVAFTRLTRLFYAESNVYRRGYALAPDTTWFGAWPGLSHDTLAFTPFPLADIFAGKAGTVPPSTTAAVARNRDVVRRITLNWVRVFPSSPDAHEALATVLETLGELGDNSDPETSALAMVRRAERLAADPKQVLRLGAAEVRILIKLETFDAARARANDLLNTGYIVGPSEAATLAGLAAVTGRVYATADFLVRSVTVDTPMTWSGEPVIAPRAAAEPARALLAYAAFGAPRDSLVALSGRTDQAIMNWVAERRRSQVREALLPYPFSLAFPEIGLTRMHRSETGGNYLLSMQWALAHHDTAAVRARLRWLQDLRADLRPGDVAVYLVFHEAWILRLLADTSAAIERLDAFLGSLPTIGLDLVTVAPETALFVRLIALRADLASARGDRRTARRWGGAVVALWQGADPPLQPTVKRMRALI